MIRVVGWRVVPYAAPFARPLGTARGTWRVRRGAFVIARDARGGTGLGEIAPLDELGGPLVLPVGLPGLVVADVEGVASRLSAWPLGLEARAAVEQALLDLLAREAGVPLAAVLADGPALARVPVNALLGAGTPAAVAAEARARVAEGFRVLKLKLAGDAATDWACVAAVREAVGPDVALRLDPNGAWSVTEARARLARLATLGPAYVEQPVEDLAALGPGPVPVAADEAAHGPGALEAVLVTGVRHVVLKPPLLGGLLAARAAIARARAHGAEVTLTSVLDRGVATAGALHLAAASGGPAAGLATTDLFTEGPALGGLAPVDGAIAIPTGPGLGFAPRLRELEKELMLC